jgi:hypothetical protein
VRPLGRVADPYAQTVKENGMSRTRAASGANRHLGLALVVIATAQPMVVLDTTIVNVALQHVQRALGFPGAA